MSTHRVLVECADAGGRTVVRDVIDMDVHNGPITLGRDVLAHVVIDDPHLAGQHAEIHVDDIGGVEVRDLDTRNGTVIAGRRHRGGDLVMLPKDSFQVGQTRVRVRSSRKPIAAERPMKEPFGPGGFSGRWTGVLLVFALAAAVGEMVYRTWLTVPDDFLADVVADVGLLGAGLLIWVGAWALLSRIIKGRWHWLGHALILVVGSLVFSAADGGFDLARYAFALPGATASMVILAAGIVVAAVQLHFHLRLATHLSLRGAALLAVAISALSLGTPAWFSARSEARNVNAISASVPLYPSELAVKEPGLTEDYMGALSDLKAQAERRRDALPPTEAEGYWLIDEPVDPVAAGEALAE